MEVVIGIRASLLDLKFLRTYGFAVVITAVCALLVFWNLPRLGLSYWDEYNYVVTAKWFLARPDGVFLIYEPPGFPFFIALLFRAFGIKDYVAIATSGMFAIMTVALVAIIGVRFVGNLVGNTASILLTVSPLFLVFSRLAMTDIAFTFFFTASVIAIFVALKSDKLRYALLAGLFLAACSSVKYNAFMALVVPVCFVPVILSRVERKERHKAATTHVKLIWIIFLPTVAFGLLFLSFLGIGGSVTHLISLHTLSLLTVHLPSTLRVGFNKFLSGAVRAHGLSQLSLVPLVEAPFYSQLLATWLPLPLLVFAAIGGVIVLATRRSEAELFILFWTVITFAIIASVPFPAPRAILPVLPPLSLISAIGLVNTGQFAVDWISRRIIALRELRIRKLLTVSLFLILIILTSFSPLIAVLNTNHSAYREVGQLLQMHAAKGKVVAEAQLVLAYYYPVKVVTGVSPSIDQILQGNCFLVVDFDAYVYGQGPTIQSLQQEGRLQQVASIHNDIPSVILLDSMTFAQLQSWNHTDITLYRIQDNSTACGP